MSIAFDAEQFGFPYNPLEILAEQDRAATARMIQEAIKANEPNRQRQLRLYERYRASIGGTPILSRTIEQPNKVNNKLNTPFLSQIVNSKVGYFAGKPITYDLAESLYQEKGIQSKYLLHDKMIAAFNRRNHIRKLDAETAKMAAICGYAARLLYVDIKGEERISMINPWETIFLNNEDTGETACAIRYYEVNDAQGKKKWYVELYDQKHITYYVEAADGTFIPDINMEINPRIHLFDTVPLIQFKNNEELQADGEQVLNLIDSYDRSFSDLNSEIEQLRLAYMVFKGAEPDEETMKAARQTGGFGIDEDQDIYFLTKNLDAQAIETHLDRLQANILQFSDSVNMTDESFAGNLSGVNIVAPCSRNAA